jgi:hypothetical protein
MGSCGGLLYSPGVVAPSSSVQEPHEATVCFCVDAKSRSVRLVTGAKIAEGETETMFSKFHTRR